MTTKHIPIRTCIVSKEKKSKFELIRIVKLENGDIKIDLQGKLKGRGANICMDLEMLKVAIDRKILNKALKLDRALTKEEKERLIDDFKEVVEEKKFREGKKPVKIRIKKEDFDIVVKKNN